MRYLERKLENAWNLLKFQRGKKMFTINLNDIPYG